MSSTHTKLELYKVQASTLSLYSRAVFNFLMWTSTSGVTLSSYTLDDLLYLYICCLYDDGGAKSNATHAVYGVRLFLPHLSTSFPRSLAALAGWDRLHTSKSYPPITLELVCLFASTLAKGGLWIFGVGFLLSFHTYLRVSELCSLNVEDVIMSRSSSYGSAFSGVALHLRHTKSGPNKFVTVTCPSLILLLKAVLNAARRSGRTSLFGFSPSQVRLQLQKVCTLFGLSHLGFVPHSFRHGGASRDFLLGRPLEDIMLRGRWASTSSARHYIQASRALLNSVKVPPHLHVLGERLISTYIHIFAKYVDDVRFLVNN